ncbi:MAG: type II secretion system protein [Campylobacterota bacterium]|nr:type II secretion system protein [Campylobacterota bacterium]
MIKIQLRTGIAMIELIFAIVIMGIVLMSAPMLIQTAASSGYVAMQQEAIAAVASDLELILTQEWDENGDENATTHSIVLDTDSINSNLEESGTTGRRVGTPESSTRKYISSTGSRRSASTTFDDGDRDDIDDFNGQTAVLSPEGTPSADIGDYIDTNMSIATTISYINDTPKSGDYQNYEAISFDANITTSATSNIKAIKVTLTSSNPASELEKNITLQAFSCNIGTYELEERSF